jgi:hypothetical protein
MAVFPQASKRREMNKELTGIYLLQMGADILRYPGIFAACTLSYFVLFCLFLRPYIKGVLDPFVYNIAFFSLSMSLTVFCFLHATSTGYWILLLVHLYLATFIASATFPVTSWRKQAQLVDFRHQRLQLAATPWFLALFWISSVVVLAHFATVLSVTGLIPPSEDLSRKFDILKENKVLSYLFRASLVMPFGSYWLMRQTKLAPFALAAVGADIGAMLYQGSRQSVLFVIIFLAIGAYLRSSDEQRPTKFLRELLLAAGIGAIAVAVTFALFVASGSGGAVDVARLLMRPILGFDQLIFMTLKDSGTTDFNQDYVQWLLAPILKVLGWYTDQYDAANHYFQVVVMGLAADDEFNRPNNNLVMEMIFTSPQAVQFIVLGIAGSAAGFLLQRSRQLRYASPIWFVIFLRMLIFPFEFLTDGSTAIQNWLLMLALVGMSKPLSILLFRPSAPAGSAGEATDGVDAQHV